MAASGSRHSFDLKEIFKKKDNIVVVAVIFTFLFFSKNIYQKQMIKYEKLKQDIVSEQEKSKSLDRIVSLNEKIKKLKGMSWETTEVNTILKKIFNLGLETQIKIRDISSGDKREDKNYTAIPFSINCETTFKNLFKFTKKLETHSQLIRLTRVAATPLSAGGRGELMLSVSLGLEAIYLK